MDCEYSTSGGNNGEPNFIADDDNLIAKYRATPRYDLLKSADKNGSAPSPKSDDTPPYKDMRSEIARYNSIEHVDAFSGNS